MPARFNHTIIATTDPAHTATTEFYRTLLEADHAPSWGPFTNLSLADDVLLQFATPPIDFPPQHYAFLVDDQHFDRALAWVEESGADYWADPQRERPREIKREDQSRGFYLLDPTGHFVELITRPYLA